MTEAAILIITALWLFFYWFDTGGPLRGLVYLTHSQNELTSGKISIELDSKCRKRKQIISVLSYLRESWWRLDELFHGLFEYLQRWLCMVKCLPRCHSTFTNSHCVSLSYHYHFCGGKMQINQTEKMHTHIFPKIKTNAWNFLTASATSRGKVSKIFFSPPEMWAKLAELNKKIFK